MTSTFLLPLSALAIVVACSSSSSSGTGVVAGSCEELGSRCHGVATPLGDECHDLGHAGDDAKCTPRRAECLAECPEKPHADGGAHDAQADASIPDPLCAQYCACIAPACGSEQNYPFDAPDSCESACAAFTAEERTCFMTFCSGALDAGGGGHDCDHAVGRLGLAECE